MIPGAPRTPPVPYTTPLRAFEAFESVNVCAPSVTPPAPESVVMLAPAVVALMLDGTRAATAMRVAIAGGRLIKRIPAVIVVAPEEVFAPERVSLPVVKVRPHVPETA